jgi:hypothetical protein
MSETTTSEPDESVLGNEQPLWFERRLLYLFPWVVLCWGSNLFVLQGLRSPHDTFWHHFAISSWLGTIYGFTSWVAAWTVLGGGARLLRLTVAIALLIGLLSASAMGMFYAPHVELEVLVIVVLLCFAQWLLAMGVIAACRYRFGLVMRHLSQHTTTDSAGKMQFGIRHIFQLTTIIAVLLALGRAVLPIMNNVNFVHREAWIFTYLAVAAILITLPMTLAGLSNYRVGVSSSIVVVGVVLITVLEILFAVNFYGPQNGPDVLHFILINSISLVWVSLFTFALRKIGYRVQMIER